MGLTFPQASYEFAEKALRCGGLNSKTYAFYRHRGMGLGMLGVLPEQERRIKSLYLAYASGQIQTGWTSIEDSEYRICAERGTLHEMSDLPEDFRQSVSYWAYTLYYDLPRGATIRNGPLLRYFSEKDLQNFEVNYTLKEYTFDNLKQHYLKIPE